MEKFFVMLHDQSDLAYKLLERITDFFYEVLEKIEIFKDYFGITIGPSQHLLPEIPIENILTMYETAYEYGATLISSC